jgi:hypothetical protein
MAYFRNILRICSTWEHLAIILVMTGIIWGNLHYKFWKDPGRIIVHDVILYYQYLPAAFIYDDLSLSFAQEDYEFFKDKVWGIKTGEGRYASKMTIGLAAMYAPFFLVAHGLAGPLGYPADGYSPPYRFFLIVASVVFAFFGLILLARFLGRYFGRKEIALTLLAVGLGTNLYFYTTIEPPMSHSFSFFLFAAFLLTADSWIRHPSWRNSLWVGIVTGLIILVRPSNGIVILILPLWQVETIKGLRDRFLFFFGHLKKVVFMAMVAFLVFLPQIIYWKYITGSYFFYGYGEERFFFNDPEFIKGLFSYRKGWLVYTPVMIFSIPGLFILYRHHRRMFTAVLVFTVVNFYIIWSWWCWWYGGGFGQRALIESYAILAIPFAAFCGWVLHRRWLLKGAFMLLLAAFVSLNLFQTRQYYKGVIHWDSMSKKAYWNTYFRTRPAPNLYEVIEPPDYSAALQGDR